MNITFFDVVLISILIVSAVGCEDILRKHRGNFVAAIFVVVCVSIIVLIGIIWFIFKFTPDEPIEPVEKSPYNKETVIASNKEIMGYKIPWGKEQPPEYDIQKYLALRFVPRLKTGIRKVYTVNLNRFKQAKRTIVAQRHINVRKLWKT